MPKNNVRQMHIPIDDYVHHMYIACINGASKMTAAVEIVASTSGFIRILQIGNRFEIQTKRIRGEHKRGALTYWHTLATVWDEAKAFAFYQRHA